MSLSTGTRLGVYELTGPLGAGGMGEVYRARDTKLGREVALKVVSESFTYDPERVARFHREAQLLAALNHPHIASIYGLEDVTEADVTDVGAGFSRPVQFLVMELVEGGTLADRLKSGPIPVDEALAIARQVADALHAAHEKGIIHRDLKPANIAFTADGQVKVLDFGLAKVLDPTGGSAIDSPALVTHSPTLSLAATQAGVILGTAAYMAPEQARGKPADKRSDIWAFGCVLYEMLAGRRAFEGDDMSDTLANVLKVEPDWTCTPRDIPVAIRILLQRCLEKDRRRRLPDISAALFVLQERERLVASSNTVAATAVPTWRRLALPAALALAAVLASGLVVSITGEAEPPRVSRLTITPPSGVALASSVDGPTVAVTPDGSRVVYQAGPQLLLRALDRLESTPIGGLVAPAQPFVSPDGVWVGFFESLAVKKVAITGGPTMTLARLDGPGARGATWGADGNIVFATNQAATGLQRVSSEGGEVTVLTRPDRDRGEGDHVWPEFLPGGQAVLFTILSASGDLDAAQVAVLDLQTGSQTVVVRGGSHARYVSSGHLLYLAGDALNAVPFDLARLDTTGLPVPVLPQVRATLSGAADIAIALDGTLAYVSGGRQGPLERTLVWVDRQGRETPATAPPRPYQRLRLSPDGTRAVLVLTDQEQDIWIWDLRRETFMRLTFDPGLDTAPVWTPDGRRILFASSRGGAWNVFSQPADGTGSAERLTDAPHDQVPTSITPDGATLIMYENKGTTDLASLSLRGDRRVQPLVPGPAGESAPAVSPDGRWLAFQSNESGRVEIYVRPYPDVAGGRWQVSTGGGTLPVWSRAGDELFFRNGGAVMSVRVERGDTWTAAAPVKLFEGPYPLGGGTPTYDVSADGGRFLIIKEDPAALQSADAQALVVVQHWLEELKRLVPTN